MWKSPQYCQMLDNAIQVSSTKQQVFNKEKKPIGLRSILELNMSFNTFTEQLETTSLSCLPD